MAVTMALVLASALKFLVKVFKRLYLLNPWMEEGHTCHDVSYWSEVLICTILTHMSDLDLRVMDVESADSRRAVDVESADSRRAVVSFWRKNMHNTV